VYTIEKMPPPLRAEDNWESLPFQTSPKYVQKNSKLCEAPSAYEISQDYSLPFSLSLKFDKDEISGSLFNQTA
jgi:hypothetical protein